MKYIVLLVLSKTDHKANITVNENKMPNTTGLLKKMIMMQKLQTLKREFLILLV